MSSTKTSALLSGSWFSGTLSSFATAKGTVVPCVIAFGMFLVYSDLIVSGFHVVDANKSFIVSVITSDTRQKSEGHGEPPNGRRRDT